MENYGNLDHATWPLSRWKFRLMLSHSKKFERLSNYSLNPFSSVLIRFVGYPRSVKESIDLSVLFSPRGLSSVEYTWRSRSKSLDFIIINKLPATPAATTCARWDFSLPETSASGCTNAQRTSIRHDTSDVNERTVVAADDACRSSPAGRGVPQSRVARCIPICNYPPRRHRHRGHCSRVADR